MSLFVFYGCLLAPALLLFGVISFWITSTRWSIGYRWLAVSLVCVGVLPIRLWDMVPVFLSATATATLIQGFVCWRSRQVNSLLARPTVVTAICIALYLLALAIPLRVYEGRFVLFEMRWLMNRAVFVASQWILLAVGIPLLLIRLRRRPGLRCRARTANAIEPPRVQLSLSTMLLTVFAVAIAFLALRISWLRCEQVSAHECLTIGAAFGLAVSAFDVCVRSGQHWVVLQFMAFTTIAASSHIDWLVAAPERGFAIDGVWWPSGLLQLLVLAGCAVSASRPLLDWRCHRWLQVGIRLTVLTLIVVAALLSLRLYHFMWRPQLKLPATPPIVNNRYGEVVDLIAEAASTTEATKISLILDRLLEVANSEDPIRVPSLDAHSISDWRDVAREALADARRLEASGESGAAVDRLLDSLLLNQRLAVGGTTIHALVRKACSDFFVFELNRRLGTADETELLRIQLGVSDAIRWMEPIESHDRRSQEFYHFRAGWVDGLEDYDVLSGRLDGLFSKSVRAQAPSPIVVDLAKEEDVYYRLLITECAVRRFKLSRGRFPQSLEELVPNYLETVPIDTFLDQPLRYRRDEKVGFLLYSVGHNRIDDGGIPRQAFDGDVTF